MKEKILESRPIRWLSGLKISKTLSEHPFFGKFCNYEMITYLIAGVLTTVVNYVVYFLMPRFGTKGLDIILLKAGVTHGMLGLATFSDAFTFALLIVILSVKPTGLFGEKITDKV